MSSAPLFVEEMQQSCRSAFYCMMLFYFKTRTMWDIQPLRVFFESFHPLTKWCSCGNFHVTCLTVIYFWYIQQNGAGKHWRWYLLMFDFVNGEVCVLLLNAKCAVGVARCQQQPMDQTLGLTKFIFALVCSYRFVAIQCVSECQDIVLEAQVRPDPVQ